MNDKCKCGGNIIFYIGFDDLAECCDCYRRYILRDKKWKLVSKNEFHRVYMKKLIKQQESNKELK